MYDMRIGLCIVFNLVCGKKPKTINASNVLSLATLYVAIAKSNVKDYFDCQWLDANVTSLSTESAALEQRFYVFLRFNQA